MLTIICLDSIGEYETFTIWMGEGSKLKQVYSQSIHIVLDYFIVQ